MERSQREYNGKVCGRIAIHEQVIAGGNKQMREMNRTKTGCRFEYSEETITITAYIHIRFRLPYRQKACQNPVLDPA